MNLFINDFRIFSNYLYSLIHSIYDVPIIMDSLENKILQMISKNKMTKRDDIQNCSH